jgi:hypothetical protein
VFSATELSQLLKLPTLVHHFIEHKEQNQELSFWQFLCIHYAKGNVKYADYDKDMKLPFKTSDNFFNQLTFCTVPSLTISNKPTYQTDKKDEQIPSDEKLISSYLSSIWQPPKIG